MWPMIAGIGPVVGEGHLGSFVEPDDDTLKWFYNDGASLLGQNPIAEVSGEPYELHRSDPPAAVLIGDRTASSGEAVVVAFQGRDQTQTFGFPTAGLSTAIRGFRLRDGAVLGLAVSTFADRTGRLYGGSISPDVYAEEPPEDPGSGDALVETARQWVGNQSTCGSDA